MKIVGMLRIWSIWENDDVC